MPASLVQKTEALAAAMGDVVTTIGTEIAAVETKQGDLAQLSTNVKTSLVAALNELDTDIAAVSSALAAVIDDNVQSAAKAWSSNKTKAMIDAAISDLIDGAPGTLNTLKELANELTSGTGVVSGIMAILAKVLRVDQAQSFSPAEQEQGRSNIGAESVANVNAYKLVVGDVDSANFVAIFRSHAGLPA
jgi:hypothetical protein